MRVLLGVVLALAVAWSGYWFVGSAAMKRAATAWLAEQAAGGRLADHGAVTVRGFPNRFDLTVDDLHLADPETGFGWTAPFVQVLTLSYTPWHWIVALPPEQTFDTPSGQFALASSELRGSLVVRPGADLALDRIRLVGEELRLRSALGWTGGAKTARFATRRLDPDAMRHEIGAELLDVALDPGLAARLPEFPPVIAQARLDATVELSAPLDRHAGTTRPGLSSVEVADVTLVWGKLRLEGSGTVAAGATGLAEGRIDLRLTEWRAALPVAVAAGLIAPQVQPTWENVLAALASRSDNPDDLDLPLSFQNGRMSLGPFPLGPAPRLR